MTGAIDRLKALVPEPAAQALRRGQTRIAEFFGSRRYSSPGLRGLDARIREHLPVDRGVYLEIGANDGFSQSNTYYLDRWEGWQGILIEPVPRLYRIARRFRPRARTFNVACVGPDGPDSIEIVDIGLMSVTRGQQDEEDETQRASAGRRSKRTYSVPTSTLSAVIDEAGLGRIDLMSVDVEGAELDVLAGLDLARHTPRVLVVETKYPERITELLSGRMELIEKLSVHDYLYRALSSD
jgi:FkbM family methyltransferase